MLSRVLSVAGRVSTRRALQHLSLARPLVAPPMPMPAAVAARPFHAARALSGSDRNTRDGEDTRPEPLKVTPKLLSMSHTTHGTRVGRETTRSAVRPSCVRPSVRLARSPSLQCIPSLPCPSRTVFSPREDVEERIRERHTRHTSERAAVRLTGGGCAVRFDCLSALRLTRHRVPCCCV